MSLDVSNLLAIMLSMTPTHVQVAVLRTRDLITKGKNGTNDVYIIYSLGKEKYQSSLKEKVSSPVLDWNEGCDIIIPTSNGNKAEVVIKAMHKASLGDKCLGRVSLPLADFDVTGKALPIWYPLRPKLGNEKDTKSRGEIEVKISFLIKTQPANNGDIGGKEKIKRKDSFKSSLGSILSLGKKSKKKKKDKENANGSRDSVTNSSNSLRNHTLTTSRLNLNNNMPIINDDPGVISEEEVDYDQQIDLQFKFDDVKSIESGSFAGSYAEKLNNTSPPSTPKTNNKIADKFARVIDFNSNKVDVNYDFRDTSNNNSPSNRLCTSPKSRTSRLPSVIVDEAPNQTDTELQDSNILSPFGSLEWKKETRSSTHSVPKISISASMTNLADPGSRKGSMTKSFMKAMFASSKHLNVDELYGDETDGSGKGDSKNHHSNTLPFNFPNLTKRRGSIRDLGIPKETYKQYQPKSKEELIAIIVNLQGTVDQQRKKISDMEEYIDKLLLRVLDNMPSLLRKIGSIRRGDDVAAESDKAVIYGSNNTSII